MPAQLCHDWVQDRNWAVQHIVLWFATCSACLHLWEGRERQWGTMFENWGLAIRGGVSGSGWRDHGDEVHALFAICSVIAITRQWVCVLPGHLESSYPQLPPFFTCPVQGKTTASRSVLEGSFVRSSVHWWQEDWYVDVVSLCCSLSIERTIIYFIVSHSSSLSMDFCCYLQFFSCSGRSHVFSSTWFHCCWSNVNRPACS